MAAVGDRLAIGAALGRIPAGLVPAPDRLQLALLGDLADHLGPLSFPASPAERPQALLTGL
jgi:hypothetical protein